MNQPISEEYKNSPFIKFALSKGWTWRGGDGGQVQVEECPFCHKKEYKFFVAVMNPEVGTRDGLFQCFHGKCNKSGNLRTLQEYTGDRVPGVDSRTEWAGSSKKTDELPDVEACHAALLSDAEVMDYLQNVRGFSEEIIVKQKLGLKEKVFFREAGTVRALVIPYLVNGNIIFAKYRTLPPSPKDFVTPSGHEVPLYNGEILQAGMNDLIFVEGEADCLSCLSNGLTNVVGVPGAGIKKASWIETLDKIAPESIYILYDNDKAGAKGAQELASRIGIEKCKKLKLPAFTVEDNGVERPGKDVNEWFTKGGGTLEVFEQLKLSAEFFDVTGVSSAKDALSQLEDELNGKVDLAPTYVTQWPSLNRLIGFEDGDVIDILAPEKIGKGGRISTPVLTAQGWKPMGELKVGEELASVDGQPSFVTGVFKRGVLPFFTVTFSDGRSTDTTADHLWKVAGATKWERQEWRVYTTDAVANEYVYTGSRRSQKLYVPLVSGDFGDRSNLPVDPWLLGVLIGDGSMTQKTVTFSSADSYIVQRVSEIVTQYGGTVKFIAKCSYRVNAASNLRGLLQQLGLYGHTAESKFIPAQYLRADKEQRLELLRGLMDTDGTAANKHGVISYCTVSKPLAKDVVQLVRSLGGSAKIGKPQKKAFRYKGEMRIGQPAYLIVVRLPEREKAFSLKRKLDKVKHRNHQPRLTFKSIEPAGVDEAVCISVSHPSKLYITDDYIVTHNTTLGLNIIDHMTAAYGESGLVVCLEMTQARLAKKWVAMLTGWADTMTTPGTEESRVKLEELKAACVVARNIQQNRDADLYFAYPQNVKTPEDVYKLIRDCIRRYGVKWVLFDNLQRLCDDTLENKAHRTIHLSQISKGFAKLTKDYGVKMIRILQPRQIENGEMVQSRHTDGSSQIAKDCDGLITMWRSAIGGVKKSEWETGNLPEQTESFDPRTKLTVALSRYSSGGTCELYFDGARSQVREPDGKKAKIDYNGIVAQEPPTEGSGVLTEDSGI